MTGISFSNLDHEVLQAYGACKNYWHIQEWTHLHACFGDNYTGLVSQWNEYSQKQASFLFHSFSQKLFFSGNQSLPGGSTLIANMQLNIK